nr:hypothetical protein [Bacteroidota bacterium]
MSKWISGKEIIEKIGLSSLELFEYVLKGLQPHDQLFKPIPPPDIQKKQTELSHLQEELKAWNSRLSLKGKLTFQEAVHSYPNIKRSKQKGPILSTFGSDRDRMKYLKRGIERIETKIEILKGELQTLNNVSWTKYELPDDNATAEAVIKCLIAYNYKSDEVEEIIDLQTQTVGMPQSKKTKEVFPCKPDAKNDLIAISFYDDGDSWKIGEKGKEKNFRPLKGFKNIAFLITNKDLEYKPLEVEHFGNIPEELEYLNKIDFQKIGDTTALDDQIEYLEEQLNNLCTHSDPQWTGNQEQLNTEGYFGKRDEIKYQLSEFKKIKNEEFKTSKQRVDQCRTNIYNNIKRAAKKIQKKLPALEKYFHYGKDKVIKTGTTFGYQQDQFNLSIDWILEEPS